MFSIPPTMSAILIEEPGDNSKLQWRSNIPVPTPAENEVLVRNDFAGVNFMDLYFRTGSYKAASYPAILGGEGAGTVVAVHPSVAASFKPGDRVAYMTMAGGAYAQYIAVSVSWTIHLPEGIAADVGAAVLGQGLTALVFVREAHKVLTGEWVLIHAAAGGTGSLLVQMSAAVGARVIGTVSTATKVEVAKRHGAEFVINTSEEDWQARVMEITESYGVDAIFDGVGKATFDGDLEVVARKGTVVCFGNTSGPVPPVDILRLGRPKNLKLCRPTLFSYVTTREEIDRYSSELFQLTRAGKMRVDIHNTYELEDVAKAHDDLEGRKSVGKLLLRIP